MGRDSRRRRYRRRVAHQRAAKRPLSWSPYRAYPRLLTRVVIVLVGPLLAFLKVMESAEETGSIEVDLVLFAVILFMVTTIRLATMGIFLSPAGVTVRNIFRTYRVPWGKVEEFDLSPHGLSLVTKDDLIPCLSHFSDRPIHPLGLQLFYEPLLRKLQADLAEHAGRDTVQLRSTGKSMR